MPFPNNKAHPHASPGGPGWRHITGTPAVFPTYFGRVTAATAKGKRPDPFRTRKLSPPAPMVLPPREGGRVGHRRTPHKYGRSPTPEPPAVFVCPGIDQVYRVEKCRSTEGTRMDRSPDGGRHGDDDVDRQRN